MATTPAESPIAPAIVRLQHVLRLFALLFLLACALYFFGGLLPIRHPMFRFAPFLSNSVVKVFALAACALYAAGNVERRLGLVRVVLGGHVASILAMGVLLLFGGDLPAVAIGARLFPARQALLGAIGLDGLILLILGLFYLPAARIVPKEPRESPDLLPSSAERDLHRFLSVLGPVFLAGAMVYDLGALLPATRMWFLDVPFVTNSVVKVATLGLLSLYVVERFRDRMACVGILVSAHVVSILGQAIYALALPASALAVPGEASSPLRGLLWAGVGLDSGIALALFIAYQRAWTARYGLHFLRPMEFRALMALSESLIEGPARRVSPEEGARRVDGYICRVRARRRIIYRAILFGLELHPLLSLWPPLSQLSPRARSRHLRTRFLKPWRSGGPRGMWFLLVQAAIRVAQQLAYLGYYSDERVHPDIGYEVFSKRPRAQGVRRKEALALDVIRPEQVRAAIVEAEICIIGSGAAGATLAQALVRAGHDVLIVERGQYVEPRNFSEDEMEMISCLYDEGVFQQTEDFRFTVLQGSCVGGSTVVNNAVCFDPPAEVLEAWNRLNGAGLDLAAVRGSVEAVRTGLPIVNQGTAKAVLNPSGALFERGAALQSPSALTAGVIDANIEGCVGCGYCNIGCAYGHKLSMLDVVLPSAQKDQPGHLRIMAECAIKRLRTTTTASRSRVTAAEGELGDGRGVILEARVFVVAAGAIASSYLLQKSGIGRGMPVGRKLSFNMGSAITAVFENGPPVRAFDGLQISHFGRPAAGSGYIFETWWNPPVAQALNMPGWFSDHYRNMRRYNQLMGVGVLVGTESRGSVGEALTTGPGLKFEPSDRDRAAMGRGLEHLGAILFDAGAEELLLNGWNVETIKGRQDLPKLSQFAQRPGYLAFGSGHPQGGNALSGDPRHGVVGPDFRVHGFDNLYVCDASVFPSSLTVNPQLTVMSLAHHAAAHVDRIMDGPARSI